MTNSENNIIEIDIKNLIPFSKHPFKVDTESSDYKMLIKSISDIGVSTPIMVRKVWGVMYEIISGHRRVTACKELGFEKISAVIREISDMEAILLMVDSNIHRENILPSEKAFAYKMKLEALKWHTANRKNNPSQVGTVGRSDEQLAEKAGESRNQIQRYIRLTKLEKPLLQMVDDKKLPLTVGVELSYLLLPEQNDLIKAIDSNKKYPSLE